MKKLLLTLLLFACNKPNNAAIQALGCGVNHSTDNKTISTPRLIVFGDSISERSGFAEMLGEELELDVWNMAVGGSDLSCQITKIESFEYVEGDTILFMVGLNDARLGRSVEELGYYMDRALIKFEGKSVILGTTLKMLSDQYANHAPHNMANDRLIEDYRDYLLSLESDNVRVVNLTDSFIPSEELFLSDRVHPNTFGATRIFDIFVGAL